ncbi:MAG: ABC transporter ATP-binding protein [Promethearchaeota archaeon]|nr:MAG: ABC transporter ATP-binding protein [Candidatus Lokiarchaeota archaeon]
MSENDEVLAIKALNLFKKFGDLTAVDNISFEISEGEIVGILGPNGAGKTTTIRIITGLFESEENTEISIFNKNLRENLELCKSKFGIVPELSNTFRDFTVWENLLFTGRIYGLSKHEVESRAKYLLNQYDLYERIKTKTKSLSKGLQQRLNFCLALLHDPPILILDEPTSGLDPISVSIMRKRIVKMKEEGKTILITTHDMQEAQNLCDRVLIMNKGKIITDADPDTLRRNFRQKSTIRFQITNRISSTQIKTLEDEFKIEKEKSGYYYFLSDDPIHDISSISQIIQNSDIEIKNLTITEASLENVFIDLIKKTKNEEE